MGLPLRRRLEKAKKRWRGEEEEGRSRLTHARVRPREVALQRCQQGALTGPAQLQGDMGHWWWKIPWDLQPGHQGKRISWHLSPERHIPVSPSYALSRRKAFPFLEVSKMQHRKLLQLPG